MTSVAGRRRMPRVTPTGAGLVLLAPFVAFALLPGVFAPYGPYDIVNIPLLGPSANHLLGTDEIGRDLLSRVVFASRNDLLVSIMSAGVAFTLGTVFGLLSGYIGGIFDTFSMRTVDVFLSFPTIVMALFLITVFGRETWVQVLAIALVMTPSTARFARGEGLVLRSRGYVEASKVSGGGRLHILFRHLLPNAMPTLLVAASVLASAAVLIAASLSYLGLGAQPPTASWGNILRSAYGVVYDAPLFGIGPGIAISVVAGAYVLIGEGIRRRFHTDRNTALISRSVGRV